MSGYRLTEPAREHIQSIWRRIAAKSRQGADRTVDRIIASCDHLGTFQVAGEPWHGRPPGLRCYAVPRTLYVLVFAPNTDPVQIVAVVHSGRDQPDVPLD